MSVINLPSPMCSAALQYARRGWAVFPCRERDGEFYVKDGKERRSKAKQPYIGNGLKDATTDEQRILAWWKRHPEAMIGLPQGTNGMFVVDFDPRPIEICDEATGEVLTGDDDKPLTRLCTLEELKADLEAQMGCPLPRSVTSITPSGGVHVYFRQPDGEPIRNRGNLPDHVDVRGLGGYTIVAPSSCIEAADSATGDYRWLRDRGDWRDDRAFADAPAALIEILRAPKAKAQAAAPAEGAPPRSSPAGAAMSVDDDIRKYGLTALDGECRLIRSAGSGKRNEQLNISALKIASLVAAGAIDAGIARASIEGAARDNPGRDDDAQLLATINSGWTAGLSSPRDLGEITASSRTRRERASSRGPSRASALPRPPGDDNRTPPFRNGGVEGKPMLGEGEAARLETTTAAWLGQRLEKVARERKAILQLAWGIGRRIAAGLIDIDRAKEALWAVYETVADVQHADVDQALDNGITRGFDPAPFALLDTCTRYPMTDFGLAERFRDRYGADYRFTTAKGWLGWDGRRWKVLDQDEKTPPAEVIAAVFDTVRDVQSEARHMAASGVRYDTDDKELALAQEHPHGLDKLIPKGKNFVKLSTMLAAWGRQSETTGKPAAVALLARRWLTVPIERFDHDKYAFNVMNGTLRFRTELLPDGSKSASVELLPHSRDDMQTKLSPVVYDPSAAAPRYDEMFGWAQPDAAMRRYLHQVGGYSLTGDAGEQKLWFWYGKGRNGKGVTMESWHHVAGDYSDSIPIGSFLDQGIKKRGDQASPDLAKLAGVRMLRSSEPGRNEKLDSGLIKLVTGGEPLPVRMLHRGFFNLDPLFKLIIQGNTKFDIPDTDDGIWGRMKLIPWLRHIERPEPGVENWPQKDPDLATKIKAKEGSGVLNRLVAGLLDYMTNGLIEPSSVTIATAAYRDDSDPLARFLRLCTAADPDAKVQSSKLYEVFAAWCKAAGEREWKQKGFSLAMVEKGIEKKASDGMWWLGVRLVKEVGDFTDIHGNVVQLNDDDARTHSRAPPTFDDDDVPL